MRRLIIAALALVAGVVWSHNAQAQILGDSLVQVIAYWSKDFVLHYHVVETEVEIENGDSTVVNTNSSLMTVKVVDADATGYTLEVETDVLAMADEEQLELTKKVVKKFGRKANAAKLRTNEFGAFTGVAATAKDRKLHKDMVDYIADVMWEEFITKDPEFADEVDEKEFKELLVQSSGTLEQAVYQEDIMKLLGFFGNQFSLKEPFIFNLQTPSLITQNPMPANSTIEAKVIDAENNLYALYQTTITDPQAALKEGTELLASIAKNEQTAEAIEQVPQLLADEALLVEDTHFMIIQADFGVPFRYNGRRVFLANGTGKCYEMEILFIPEDEAKELRKQALF